MCIKPKAQPYDMTKSAFVTGSTGFLGRHLCRQLLQAGWQVTAMCRSIPENALDGANYVEADLLDRDSLMAAMPQAVDVVFHTAADTNTWHRNNPRQTQTNTLGTLNLIQAAVQQQAKKWIHVSSIVTYGVDHPGMAELDEQTAQHGLDSWVNYVKTKSLAETLVKDHAEKLQAVVVNPTHIIGPNDQHNWVRLFKMMANDSLPTIPPGAGSFVDVRDVAQGCILAAENGRLGENYILGGHNLSFTKRHKPQALIKLVAKIKSATGYLTGKEPDLTPESLQIISHQYRTNCRKAQTELGYSNRPLATSLADIQADLKQRGILGD